MATRSRKSRRSCKHGKLKRPVRTKKGGKRRCKKSKSRKSKKKKSYKMRGLEDMPNEILTGIFENSSLDDLKRLYNTNRHMRSIAIQVVRGKIMDGYDLFASLEQAIKLGDIDTVRLILDAGADVNTQNEFGYTPLMIASILGQTEIANLLIQRGADIDARDNGGDTAVMYASNFGHTDTVILLIQRGADINIENDSRLSPIASAFMNNHTEVVEVLRQAGAIQDFI